MSKSGLWFRRKIALPLLWWDNQRERRKLLKQQQDLPKKLDKVERRLKVNDEEYNELRRYEELLWKYSKEENK